LFFSSFLWLLWLSRSELSNPVRERLSIFTQPACQTKLL
jgi:hypothetical protein